MNNIDHLFKMAQESDGSLFGPALSDLRYIIERHTMDRYGEEERQDYYDTFYEKSLVDVRLSFEELTSIKYFLFYLLFNFPNRSTLTAKCLKVLFDTTSRNAICAGIEVFRPAGSPSKPCVVGKGPQHSCYTVSD